MKKAKQRNLYEDKSDPMGGLDRHLDEDDDEIIDLEDIIEMPDRPIDEEEDLDLDVGLFDMDEELESRPERSARKPPGAPVQESLRRAPSEEEDLFESLAVEAEEENDLLFEPTPPAPAPKPSEQKAKPQMSDEDEFDLEGLLSESDLADLESGLQEEEKTPLKEGGEAAFEFAEEPRSEEIAAERVSEPSIEVPADAPADLADVAAEVSPASPPEVSALAEEIVERIEVRLQEHIRAVVESMLPGLVRSILDEEITKLKQELG